VIRHLWQEYLEQAEDIRHSTVGRDSYSMRSQTIERVFADAKEKHGMRYTYYWGLSAVSKWVKLKFAAMNLKKMAIWKWKTRPDGPNNPPHKLFFAFWTIIIRAKVLRIKRKEPCFAFV
jgi:hypothetical protein